MWLFLLLDLPGIMKDLGNILKSLRIAKGISQDALAFEMEVSLSTYSKLERGLSDITLSKLEKLAAFYGMNVVDILLHGTDSLTAPNICKRLIEEKDKEIIEKKPQRNPKEQAPTVLGNQQNQKSNHR